MSNSESNSWQDIQKIVLERIHSRQWKPGDMIPNETELAAEFGCARATVNRALQAIADSGLLDRKRKAGTRVTVHPERKAIFSIPIIRKEVEALKKLYSHRVLQSDTRVPPLDISQCMKLETNAEAVRVDTVHMANEKPYAYEERWINPEFLPTTADVNFSEISANEWLVQNAPLSTGDLVFSALNATGKQARILQVDPGQAIFSMTRKTSHKEKVITLVKLAFAPGYELRTSI